MGKDPTLRAPLAGASLLLAFACVPTQPVMKDPGPRPAEVILRPDPGTARDSASQAGTPAQGTRAASSSVAPAPGGTAGSPRGLASKPRARARGAAFQQLVEGEYRIPAPEIVTLLTQEGPPHPLVHAAARRLALVFQEKTIPLERLARPSLGLAGIRIDPRNHTTFGHELVTHIEVGSLDTGGQKFTLLPPEGALLDHAEFSPSGRFLSASVIWPDRVGLVFYDLEAQTQTLIDEELSAVWGNPCTWVDERRQLCQLVAKPMPPGEDEQSIGPNVTEHVAGASPARTYRHLLQSKRHDELFERHFAAVPALVDADGSLEYLPVRPGITFSQDLSPSGDYLLHVTLERPFPRLVTASRFPRRVRVLDRAGETVHEIALPDGGAWPTRGNPLGPRAFRWDPTRPACLVYPTATLENGVRLTDLIRLEAPFDKGNETVWSGPGSFGPAEWTTAGTLLINRLDVNGGVVATYAQRGKDLVLVEDRSADPKAPSLRDALRENGDRGRILERSADGEPGSLFLLAKRPLPEGGTRQGVLRRPLAKGASGAWLILPHKNRQTVVALLHPWTGETLVTRESLRSEPNYFVVRSGRERKLTDMAGTYAALSGVRRIPLSYQRDDGVQLTASLYLPPGFETDGCRATVFWIYPGDDPKPAVPLSDAEFPFWEVSGPSRLSVLLAGYALLDQPSMPIIGNPGEENDHYLTQLEQSARAAAAELARQGLCDPSRLAVAGRSYGAFSSANLLIHTDLFTTGIAFSGAYNRTLTPFGFQDEKRSFWDATELYTQISPFFHAHQMNQPILLLHGEEDENPGTPPLQSERFFQALAGNGSPVRWVSLPLEGHRFRGHESVLHAAAEMIDWLDRHFPIAEHLPSPERTEPRRAPGLPTPRRALATEQKHSGHPRSTRESGQ